MKITRRFNGSWFVAAVAATIVVGEIVARQITNAYGIRANPLMVAFLCAGLVGAIASVLYDGADVD